MLPTPQTEINLIRDLKANLPTAFSSLYDSYSPAMFGTLLRYVKDHERAEDLLHDAFIKVWLNIHCYDSRQGRLFTWLLTITKRVALDDLRAEKVRATAATYIYERSDGLINSNHSMGMVCQSITSTLEPKYRQVIELLYFQDYTGQEVADKLKLPLGTVKTRYRMALQKLKQSFRQDIKQYNLN